ncbi:hypothetical protein [Kitasatospora sp. NPDC058478]|uniref:hypothetical protein n=1 Tax=unclassified Kitasatospora TaxID=2633591 RepID=UPI003666C5A9
MSTETAAVEFEDETTGKRWTLPKLPAWTPGLILWVSRIALAVATAYIVLTVVRAEIALHSLGLPWWVLVVFYSGVFGVLLRLGMDAKKGWTQARHQWQTYVRWANGLT